MALPRPLFGPSCKQALWGEGVQERGGEGKAEKKRARLPGSLPPGQASPKGPVPSNPVDKYVICKTKTLSGGE